MLIRYVTALSAAGLAWPALAADMALKVEIPRLAVAEYHRPYVAIWIEKPDQSFAGNLAVWYDIKMRNNEGTKWLKDMRAWWRKSGRELTMPVDGISGATRAPGEHTVQFADATALAKLAPGEYQLVLEAAREVGGREQVKVPFVWPPKAATTTQARGEHELGAVSVTVKP
ncbi:MAG: DUF2271 domain-containing protein [Hydrogenophaga sp.]|jgi:hypothetical protein|uniref:DUF2271 domain-containing protein n=1 Tax=Hydrogenophaga sp. TaxID=1904254 RepID=UPI001DB83F88|nr:DUF2271 domain-containing protein [Hydrogenophaga sp.]MBW0171272.1 DUF2271 domain-containing protein [Hydrogenophaga sp.]MBW0186435.1 DUF2271 domain-containing protein [Hydrogenophaga sp.]